MDASRGLSVGVRYATADGGGCYTCYTMSHFSPRFHVYLLFNEEEEACPALGGRPAADTDRWCEPAHAAPS